MSTLVKSVALKGFEESLDGFLKSGNEGDLRAEVEGILNFVVNTMKEPEPPRAA